MILDTNALSAIADGDPTAGNEFGKAEQAAVPVIALGEYLYGIARSRRKAEYEEWVSGVLSTVRLLEINHDTALEYAAIRNEIRKTGTPIPVNDLWIAALCRQHSLPLLSRDAHFDLVRGIRRIVW